MEESNWLDLSSTLGLIATAVLSFNFLLGILLSTAYRRSPLWKRMPALVKKVSLDDLHNWTAYVALALALAHPLLLLVDKSLRYRVSDIVLPVFAPHQPLWTLLGSLALYALIVVIITTQKAVKRRLGFRFKQCGRMPRSGHFHAFGRRQCLSEPAGPFPRDHVADSAAQQKDRHAEAANKHLRSVRNSI